MDCLPELTIHFPFIDNDSWSCAWACVRRATVHLLRMKFAQGDIKEDIENADKSKPGDKYFEQVVDVELCG